MTAKPEKESSATTQTPSTPLPTAVVEPACGASLEGKVSPAAGGDGAGGAGVAGDGDGPGGEGEGGVAGDDGGALDGPAVLGASALAPPPPPPHAASSATAANNPARPQVGDAGVFMLAVRCIAAQRGAARASFLPHLQGPPGIGSGGHAPVQGSIRIQVVFSSVYLSNACNDLSRPLPLCLKPPKGTVMSSSSYWLTCTVPARSARATRWARLMLSLHTLACRP